MGVLIQLGAFLEVLAPDSVWLSLLTLAFFNMIVFAEALGVLASWGTVRVLELSVLLAYVVSIGIFAPSAVRSGSGQTSLNRDSHLSSAELQDASE